ncbi:hypothetical protein SAMN06265171_102671 [Chryseobacterium rhizoplanae]|uniref:Uncharacterized protein n=1 Tax=Chryseobacterium rhizoplanae TaxID=1609531 RepID=A0A521CD44_9FLAO|nr:hypothetical protein [Chryseobacterium rhizoplanae]SMO56721.1 hypothetical protein SAMN06265171_102671 [Chryseobacterium rhizoplanae]
MIEIILMLLGLAFSNNNANTAADNSNNQEQITVQLADPGEGVNPGDTGGDTGPVLPPKK